MKLSILIKFCLIFHLSRRARCRIATTRNVTGIWGQTRTLTCTFDGDPIGVYWHKHKATGDLDSETEIVVTNFRGSKIIRDTRYDITDDFSIVIKKVTTEDETTFSCEVALEDGYDGKNYTDVTVIALANPLHPVVLDCEPTEHNRTCLYTLQDSNAEVFHLTCGVDLIRPSVKLTWTASLGPPPITGDPDKRLTSIPGLYNVSLIAQVPRTSIGGMLECVAEGDAVKGNSSITVIIGETKIEDAPRNGLSPGGIVGIFFLIFLCIVAFFAFLIVLGVGFWFYRKRRDPAVMKDGEEDILLLEEKAVEAEITKLSKQIENYTTGSLGTKTREFDVARMPARTKLSLTGTNGSGKTSCVRSLYYAANGRFMDIEIASASAHGGVATTKTAYDITNSIFIQNARGLVDFDPNHIHAIVSGITADKIHCPVIVLRANTTGNEGMLPFISDLNNRLYQIFGSRPMLVMTHKDKLTAEELSIKEEILKAGDILPERIISVSNVTNKRPEVGNTEHHKQRLEFMRLLLKLLEIADNNIIHMLNESQTGDPVGP